MAIAETPGAGLRVGVLATSYPRHPGDPAGQFVADLVRAAENRGVAVDVVSPASFRSFGLAYGHGIVGNIRAAPWKGALVPPFLLSFAHAARRLRGVDLFHAHWIPSALAALATGRPYVLQVWGTDVELARRLPQLVRPVVRRAQLVIAASTALAEEAERLGARSVAVIPGPIDLPVATAAREAEPSHALFVGRLSPEKGIAEFLQATEGLPRVVVGDGPLRHRVPEAIGFVERDRLGEWYDRAAVVVCPSRREGYGVVAREAMAHGRAVIVSDAGGLKDAVTDDVTGLVVPAGDHRALRAAVERLLDDPALRSRLGQAAREHVRDQLAPEHVGDLLVEAYRSALADR